jgi:serine/threonine protein kinase
LFLFYDVRENIGEGRYGTVKAAIHKKTGMKVAVKIIHKEKMTPHDLEMQKREIEVMKLCQHPYIVRLLDIFENHDYIYLVMEYLEGGDLFEYLD